MAGWLAGRSLYICLSIVTLSRSFVHLLVCLFCLFDEHTRVCANNNCDFANRSPRRSTVRRTNAQALCAFTDIAMVINFPLCASFECNDLRSR